MTRAFLCVAIAAGVCALQATAIQAEPVDSLQVQADEGDGYPLNDRAITRIPSKILGGLVTSVATAGLFISLGTGGTDFGTYLHGVLGLFIGWPVGVYLADPVESSLWMTTVGHGVGLWTARKGVTAWWAIPGFAIIASELSRLAPKGMRKPLQWLFGKARRPDARVSFGLAPEPRRGLSARASLHF